MSNSGVLGRQLVWEVGNAGQWKWCVQTRLVKQNCIVWSCSTSYSRMFWFVNNARAENWSWKVIKISFYYAPYNKHQHAVCLLFFPFPATSPSTGDTGMRGYKKCLCTGDTGNLQIGCLWRHLALSKVRWTFDDNTLKTDQSEFCPQYGKRFVFCSKCRWAVGSI